MAVMTISEARAALPDVVNRVEAGEEVTITRHGRAVAVIVRPDVIWRRPPADRLRAAAEGLERILQEAADSGISAGGLTEQYAEELIANIRAGRDAR